MKIVTLSLTGILGLSLAFSSPASDNRPQPICNAAGRPDYDRPARGYQDNCGIVGVRAAEMPQKLQDDPGLVKDIDSVQVQGANGKRLTADEVRKAIIIGAAIKNWIVVGETPGKLRLQLYIRSHQAFVEVRYDADAFGIKYVNSVNLRYRETGDGRRMIHPNYNKWIDDLVQAINSALLTV